MRDTAAIVGIVACALGLCSRVEAQGWGARSTRASAWPQTANVELYVAGEGCVARVGQRCRLEPPNPTMLAIGLAGLGAGYAASVVMGSLFFAGVPEQHRAYGDTAGVFFIPIAGGVAGAITYLDTPGVRSDGTPFLMVGIISSVLQAVGTIFTIIGAVSTHVETYAAPGEAAWQLFPYVGPDRAGASLAARF